MNHFQSRYRDKTVERDAHAAHYAFRDARKEQGERGEEGAYYCHYSGGQYRNYRGVARDGYATDRFAVCGIGAAAEERARYRAYAVAEKRTVQSGVFEKIGFDYRRNVFVIGYMFGEHDERDGYIGYRYRADISSYLACGIRSEHSVGHYAVATAVYVERGEEGEVGVPCLGIGYRGELGKVYHAQTFRAFYVRETGEDRGERISRKNAYYERDHLEHFLAVYRAYYRDYKRGKSAQQRDKRVGIRVSYGNVRDLRTYYLAGGGVFDQLGYLLYNAVRCAALHQVAYGVARERQSDYGDRRSDDNGGHDLIYPFDSRELDNKRYYAVYKPREHRADQKSEIAKRHGYAACECRAHRA